MSSNWDIAIRQIRKDWGIPDQVTMIWNKDKLLPVGYQALPHKAVNDNEARK